jgi:hypothetical protein
VSPYVRHRVLIPPFPKIRCRIRVGCDTVLVGQASCLSHQDCPKSVTVFAPPTTRAPVPGNRLASGESHYLVYLRIEWISQAPCRLLTEGRRVHDGLETGMALYEVGARKFTLAAERGEYSSAVAVTAFPSLMRAD